MNLLPRRLMENEANGSSSRAPPGYSTNLPMERVQSRRFRPLCGILMPNSVIVQLSVQSLNILGV